MSKRGERELATFTAEIQRKLDLNAHKGTWKGESPLWLLRRLSEEVSELEEALFRNEGYADVDDVRQECADVALFSMFVADVVGGLE